MKNCHILSFLSLALLLNSSPDTFAQELSPKPRLDACSDSSIYVINDTKLKSNNEARLRYDGYYYRNCTEFEAKLNKRFGDHYNAFRFHSNKTVIWSSVNAYSDRKFFSAAAPVLKFPFKEIHDPFNREKMDSIDNTSGHFKVNKSSIEINTYKGIRRYRGTVLDDSLLLKLDDRSAYGQWHGKDETYKFISDAESSAAVSVNP